MSDRTCLSIVLAAGEGTRMRSSLPKVLHAIGGQTLLTHVLRAVDGAGTGRTTVVVGPDSEAVAEEAKRAIANAEIAVQRERRGTAHAVLAAKTALERGADDILVIFGDTPLIRASTLQKLRDALAAGAAIAVLGFRPKDPSGYGRIVTSGNKVTAIREEKDASESERKIALCNGGLMALAGKHALAILARIDAKNSKKEFYLTDAVAIAVGTGLDVVAQEVEEDEVMGINTKTQWAEAEAVLQTRLRKAALEAGVTMTAPETVFLAADTKFGKDVIVEPYVVFGPGVMVADKAIIHSFSHLSGAQVGVQASVGPFARLRPGTQLGENTKVGNFCETKEAKVEAGAKINHLSYVGDARVGAGANIGAGVITCNYDGATKHHTDIGKDSFVGTNSSLVAPVKIGDGAYIASGSVITDDVPANALAFGRARQSVKEGGAESLRGRQGKGKKAPKAG